MRIWILKELEYRQWNGWGINNKDMILRAIKGFGIGMGIDIRIVNGIGIGKGK